MPNDRLRTNVRRTARAALLATTLLVAQPALAQLTTSTIRGVVSTGTTAAPGATITAKSVETNAVTRATAGPDGSYVLTGLRPGTYDISFAAAGGQASTQRVTIEVGQTATLDADTAATAPTATTEPAATTATATSTGSDVVVTGQRLIETKTSEIATNVNREQIENLPQNNRNFLNFAALAPGVRVSTNNTRQSFSGGGVSQDPNGESLASPQVNVFIDGVSLKSTVQQGGLVGQDASRGNPFSQLAVQEFRVLTSNFKAEFEDAGTSIITAVTKSGTNQFHGQAFIDFQNQDMIERDFFQDKFNQPKPNLKRIQYGAALGGPIIRDKLFFFVNYEANRQDRTVNVVPGGSPAERAQLPFDVNALSGTFSTPFREQLGFGKLNYQMSDNHEIELTGSIRKETDLRDFGGQTAASRATNIANDTYTTRFTDRIHGESFTNEATIDFLRAKVRFGSNSGTDFGLNYQNIVQVGGRSDFQAVVQQGLTLRDNLSFQSVDWHGNHLFKIGAKLSLQKYTFGGSGPFANPEFQFRTDASQNISLSQPFEVNFGSGNPNLRAKTKQIGLFAQDDWAIDNHLTLNLGLRWDYDSNTGNNGFVTPASAAAALRNLARDPRIQPSFFNVEDYISTGNNRKANLKQFQPRLGFSYDVNADQHTVLFGGYGRYFDRVLFRNAAEESLFTQYRRGNIQFSRDGLPRNGQPTVRFDPSYLTPAGFQTLLTSLRNDPTSPGTSELRIIPNNLKSPYTDQFSLGVRQRLGVLRTSLSYSYIIGKDQVGYSPLNRTVATNSGGFYDFIPLINGYSNVVAAFNTRGTRYHAVYLTVDKPYSRSSHWGGGIAYTYARSKERGFSFNFDFPNIEQRPYVPNSGDERHHLVANGIVDVPLGIKLSSLVTYGSGAPFFVIDASQGFGARDIKFPGNVGNVPHFLQVDLRAQKGFKLFGSHEFSLSAEVFNLFNRANFGGADGFIPKLPEINSNFGIPNGLSGPPRSFQVGASYKF
jgi:outer membrane receptor protein involved in Fe transport